MGTPTLFLWTIPDFQPGKKAGLEIGFYKTKSASNMDYCDRRSRRGKDQPFADVLVHVALVADPKSFLAISPRSSGYLHHPLLWISRQGLLPLALLLADVVDICAFVYLSA